MSDTLEIFGTEYTGVTGFKATDSSSNTKTYIRPEGSQTITTNNTYDVTSLASVVVNVSGSSPTISSLSVTPSESEQTFNSSSVDGYKPVTVGAISSTYVGSGITRCDADDIFISDGAVVLTPGYYDDWYEKFEPTGTAGTPVATKGNVSNHSISVTPSVTNTSGYITGSTITGTSVSVSASELVSGNKSIADNGSDIDVTNYATVSVSVPFVTVYTGSSAPSSSTGSNGDIYIQE